MGWPPVAPPLSVVSLTRSIDQGGACTVRPCARAGRTHPHREAGEARRSTKALWLAAGENPRISRRKVNRAEGIRSSRCSSARRSWAKRIIGARY
jgi:hypothetical protein